MSILEELGASKMIIFKVALLAIATVGVVGGVMLVKNNPKSSQPKAEVLSAETFKPTPSTSPDYIEDSRLRRNSGPMADLSFEDIVTAPINAVKEKVQEFISEVKNTATISAGTAAQSAATAAFQKLSPKDQEVVKSVICK